MEDVTKKHEILTKAVEHAKRESGAKKVLKSTKYIKDAEEEAKRETTKTKKKERNKKSSN